jgi:hypothetical protein
MFVKGPYRLKLTKLSFLSAVDSPAQGKGAQALLLKRDGAITLRAKVAKTNDELGLVFGYAFSSSLDGGQTAHVDYQDDAIDPDFLKTAMDFVAGGGATDVNHDGDQDGRVVFAWPLLPEINKALGIDAKTIGLAVAIKPSAETYAKFKSGELTGFSIAGEGEREPLEKGKQMKCAKCSAYMKDDDVKCAKCGATAKGMWTTATVDDFPDSSFLYVEPGGQKDGEGKTTPRSLRHFPYRDENGKVDMDHLRNAISRIPQSSLAPTLRNKLQVKAEKLLAAQHEKRIRKGPPVLTSEDDGHQHVLDPDDACCCDDDDLRTASAITADGNWHDHAWLFDAQTGAITIAANAGHTHTVDASLDMQTLMRANALAAAPEEIEDEDSDGIPMPMSDEDSSGKVSIAIAMRANSTPRGAKPHGGHVSKENPMKIVALTEREHAHYSKLNGADAEAFLAKSSADREAILKAAVDADPIVFKGEVTGAEVRKSDGPLAKKLAEQSEQQAVSLKKQADELAKRDEAIEKAEVRKQAAEHLGKLAGADDVHDFIVRACRKAGDAEMLAKALTAMKGWNALGKGAERPAGVNPGADAGGNAGTPLEVWNGAVKSYAEKNGLKDVGKAEDMFLGTPEGRVAKRAYNEAHGLS